MRGWLHAATVPAAAAGAFLLWHAASSQGHGRLSAVVFGIGLVGLYTTSSLYHVGRWSARARWFLSRCDVAMIQLFIAATFTPVALHALSGRWRIYSLVFAWVIGVSGAAIAASPLRAPRWVSTMGYIAVGWLAVVPFTRIVLSLPWEASGLIGLGGVLYTVGGLVYARRRPDPFPLWFGYHEVFHLLVVAASACHYVAIWRYVIPR